jgi:outer membrane lipopolysaccharide assembly protein LptE/RlpB
MFKLLILPAGLLLALVAIWSGCGADLRRDTNAQLLKSPLTTRSSDWHGIFGNRSRH